MGRTTRATTAKQSASANTESPVQAARELPLKNETTAEEILSLTPKVPAKKRKRNVAVKVAPDADELPHGLGKILANTNAKVEDLTDELMPMATPKASDNIVLTSNDINDVKINVEKVAHTITHVKEEPVERKKAKKTNQYGITLGITPYPDWQHPTPEECRAVNEILSKTHGEVKAPKSIPAPSLTVAGCGEVEHILDAMMRTLLSAHTTNKNAGAALEGLVKRFGVLQNGNYKGTINWDAVRLASQEDVEEAIRRGGLAKRKSTNIKQILNAVYDENRVRRTALAEKGVMSDDDMLAMKILEDPSILTLDFYHTLSMEEAFNGFIKYPGIGVKTASCILLFCMQKPSFAVDTHVFRLCGWLGWVPKVATRDTTFAHCDVRIPNELKYSLHQLLIRHGKQCGRCRAITGEASGDWSKGCPLEELVKRTGVKKGGLPVTKKATKAVNKGKLSQQNDGNGHDDGSDVGESTSRMAKKQKKSTKSTAIATSTISPPKRTRKAVSKPNSVPIRSRKISWTVSDDSEFSALSESGSDFDPDESY